MARLGPTAYFPPAFPYFLGVVDLIDGHAAGGKTAVPPERVAQAVIGTVSVGLLGLVALEAFGGGPALAALAIGAAYPVFVELSGTLVAENLLLVFELAAIWTALRARRARHPYLWIAATGVLTGLATLTHENAALFALPLGVAAWSVARARGDRPAAAPARPPPASAPWRRRRCWSRSCASRSLRGRSAMPSSCTTSCPSPTRPGSR